MRSPFGSVSQESANRNRLNPLRVIVGSNHFDRGQSSFREIPIDGRPLLISMQGFLYAPQKQRTTSPCYAMSRKRPISDFTSQAKPNESSMIASKTSATELFPKKSFAAIDRTSNTTKHTRMIAPQTMDQGIVVMERDQGEQRCGERRGTG